MNAIQTLIRQVPSEIREFSRFIHQAMGGHTYIVGGAVRDAIMGAPVHDFDIEVTGVSVRDFEAIPGWDIRPAGDRFGVWLVSRPGDPAFEVAMPQERVRTGAGHAGEVAIVKPYMPIEQSLERRDFTMNAMAVGVFGGAVIDPFGGMADISAGVLRCVNPDNFGHDPLRVLRGMQFAARFNMSATPETIASAQANVDGFATLSPDRIRAEWAKWAGSRFPAMGIRFLQDCGWLAQFPIIGQLAGIEQDSIWHPEGDVLSHNIQALDHIENVCDPIVTWGVFLHDIGKITTTTPVDGRITSPGHADVGAEMVVDALRGCGFDINDRIPEWVQAVQAVVREHMRWAGWQGIPTNRAVNRMARDIQPATIRQWWHVCMADIFGRGVAPSADSVTVIQIAFDRACANGVVDQAPAPIIMGRHIVAMGVRPGRIVGEIVEAAMQAQMDGEFSNVVDGVGWVMNTFGIH